MLAHGLASGMLSGIISRLLLMALLYPLDTLRVRVQVIASAKQETTDCDNNEILIWFAGNRQQDLSRLITAAASAYARLTLVRWLQCEHWPCNSNECNPTPFTTSVNYRPHTDVSRNATAMKFDQQAPTHSILEQVDTIQNLVEQNQGLPTFQKPSLRVRK